MPAKLKKLLVRVQKPTKRQFKYIAPVAVAVIVAASFAVTSVVTSPEKSAADKAASEAYKQRLLSQVDNADGAPRDGRDPANQQQTSLASAASNPTGAGRRTDNPASGVDGSTGNNHGASGSNAEKTGLNSAGCYFEYGRADQCVPAHAATNGELTCEGVTTHGGFKDGVIYSKDRFNLDKNKNGTACDHGDF